MKNIQTLFLLLLGISVVIFILSLFVKSDTKHENKNQQKQSYKGIIIATFSQGAVNSFLISYAKELHLGNIGLFFTMTAVVTFISRFFYKKIQDLLGLEKLSFILTISMSISIFMILFIQNEIQLFLLAIPYGLSVGLLFPIFNYRIIQTVESSQFAYATSIYYCGIDIGYGLGAVTWGYMSQYFGYHMVYFLVAILLVIMAFLDQIIYRKVS